MYDATLAIEAIVMGMLQGNADYKQTPFLSGYMANYNVDECADKKWIALGALDIKFWKLFCDIVDRPSWKTAENTDLIIGVFDKQKLEDLFKTETRDEWVNKSINLDVCLAPVLEVNEVIGQKKTAERGMFKDFEIDDITIKIYAKPYKSYSFS